MLRVDRVIDLKVLKMVRLVAPSAETYTANKALGRRFMKLIAVRFEVRAGESLNLPYPFWAGHAVGQLVALADIARHPLGPRCTPIA